MDVSSTSRRLVYSAIFFAAACLIAVLAGWVLELGWLTSFGSGTRPMRPLGAIAGLSLALALAAAFHGRQRLSIGLLVPALAIAAATAWQAP